MVIGVHPRFIRTTPLRCSGMTPPWNGTPHERSRAEHRHRRRSAGSCPARSPGAARPPASACAGSPTGCARRCSTRATPRSHQAGPEVAVVLHFLDPANARPYRRKNAPTFVVALAELDAPPSDVLRTGLPAARAWPRQPLRDGEPDRRRLLAQFVTLEQGTYAIDTTRRRRRVLLQVGVLARRAARDVAPRDRERVHLRPRARALGRRRHHPSDHACGRAPRRPRPAPGRVPDRGDPLGPRPAAREAAVRHRRAELRERERTPRRCPTASRSRSTG